jgi:hypothetical protein
MLLGLGLLQTADLHSLISMCLCVLCIITLLYQAYGITKQRSHVVVKVGDVEKQTTIGIGEPFRQQAADTHTWQLQHAIMQQLSCRHGWAVCQQLWPAGA